MRDRQSLTGISTSRRALLKAIGVGSLTGLAGCIGGSGSGDSESASIGVVSPMTGPYGSLAQGQRRGAELGIKHINESDDIDVEFDATYEDTELNPSTGQRKVRRLVQNEGADFIMGAISSSVALAISAQAEDQQFIYATGGSALELTGAECNAYTFRSDSHTGQLARGIADWTLNNLGTKVWFHIADYAYGQSVLNETQAQMEASDSDVEVVGVSRAEQGAENHGSYITDIKDSEAEVVVLGMTGGDFITFVTQAAQQGLSEQVDFMGDSAYIRSIRGALGESVVGHYTGIKYLADIETSDNSAFVDAYTQEYDDVPGLFARVGYDSVRMLASGITEAGSSDPEEVKDALPGASIQSVLKDNTTVRECDNQSVNPIWIGEVVAGDEGFPEIELIQKNTAEDVLPECDEMGCSK